MPAWQRCPRWGFLSHESYQRGIACTGMRQSKLFNYNFMQVAASRKAVWKGSRHHVWRWLPTHDA